MITAQQQEWGALGRRLGARNATVGWRLVVAPAFTSEELATVLAAYPGLRDIVFRGRLTGVLETPKVLDTILTAMRTGTVDQTAPLTGEESAFAQWFFDHLVCGAGGGRAARGALIMRLAERQGDRLQAQTPLIELDPAGLEHLDPLERDGVCVMQDGRVRFAHDLFGDWVRQQLILAQVDDRAGYVQARLTSPLWHRATRLHALALLATENPDAWREEMDRLGGRELGLLHDLFLKAPLFASDPGPVLETLWPGLVEADGRLLRRLLSRFLHIATFPHPGMVEAVSGIAEELSTEVAATQRVPYWPLWVPVLGLMSTHADEVLALAGDEVARITDLWLRWTPDGFPLREEAATLAIGRARAFLASAPPYGAEAEAARAWRAMLAAVREHRDDVIEISAALTPPREEGPTGRSEPGSGVRVRTRIDEPFRETCLDGDALYPVITADPELAGELMFAVLEPRPPTVGWGLPGDEIGIGRMPNWFTPLYTRGPFLLFLRTAPTDALAFIRRLVEAATDRWIEAHTEGTSARLEVTLADGTTIGLRGDEAMMQWYRGETQVPSPLACALMALEKWLYDEADAGRDIARTVADLLAGTTSIAMTGLLIAIGCRHPELLSGPLQPLLGAPDLYLWDTRAKLRSPSHLRIGLFREHDEFRDRFEEWFTLEHRGISLEQRAQWLLLTDPPTETYLSEQLLAWRERLDADGEPAAVRYLTARLDRANWKQAVREDGELVWTLDPPAELQAECESTAQELAMRRFWLTFPTQCRQNLDGELELAADQLEALWELATTRLADPPPEDIVGDGVISADDPACGLAAVLFLGFRDWLREHPEREQYCLDALLAAVDTERERHWFESAEGGTDWTWDAFAAQAIPVIWSELPDEPVIRRAIARLAFSLSYATIRRLFAGSAAARDALGEDFGRLQHLGVRIALFRRRFDVARERADADPPDRDEMLRYIDAFVDGSLEPVAPAWAALASPPAGVKQPWSEIDTGYLHAAYAWVPAIDQAHSSEERKAWVRHWEQSVIELVDRLTHNIDPDDGEVDLSPAQADLDLLRQLPQRIIDMTSEEARRIWRPILDLGGPGHAWVSAFLATWCIVGLAASPATEGFIAKWEEMIEYVDTSSTWATSPPSLYGLDPRHTLLGLNGTTLDMWSAEHAPVIERLAPHLETVCRPTLAVREAAAVFARLLRRPGAAPLLVDGLAWLAGADTGTATVRHDDGYEDALGALLDHVARHDPDIPKDAGTVGTAYRALLTRLADRQVPIALELIARMAALGES